MSWQDVVLSLGVAFFTIAGLLMLADRRTAISRRVSAWTAAVLFVFALTYASLGLLVTAWVELAQAAIWVGLTLYRSPEPEAMKELSTDYVPSGFYVPPDEDGDFAHDDGVTGAFGPARACLCLYQGPDIIALSRSEAHALGKALLKVTEDDNQWKI